MVAVFYTVPAQCMLFRQLPKGAAGVRLNRNAKDALVAEQATHLLENLGLLP